MATIEKWTINNILINKTGGLIEMTNDKYPPLIPFQNNETLNIYDLYKNIIEDSNEIDLILKTPNLNINIKVSDNNNKKSILFISSENKLELIPEIDQELQEIIFSITGEQISSSSNSEVFSKISSSQLLSISNRIQEKSQRSGAGGDPYIITLDNSLYKMSNQVGYFRMIQGDYMNKLFTINISTIASRDKDAMNTDKFVNKYIAYFESKNKKSTSSFINHDHYNYNEVFINKIFIQWGDEYILIDLYNLSILDNKSTFKITDLSPNSLRTFNTLEKMVHYRRLVNESKVVNINSQLSVVVSRHNNPQFNTSFVLENGSDLRNCNGLMYNKLFSKDTKLKKINCLDRLKRNHNRLPKRYTQEIYLNDQNQEYNINIPIF